MSLCCKVDVNVVPLPSCINKGIKNPAWSSLNDVNLPQTHMHEVFDMLKYPMCSWAVFLVMCVLNSQVCYTMLAMAMKTMGTASWFLLMLQIPIALQTACVCRTSSNGCRRRRQDWMCSCWICVGKGRVPSYRNSEDWHWVLEGWFCLMIGCNDCSLGTNCEAQFIHCSSMLKPSVLKVSGIHS